MPKTQISIWAALCMLIVIAPAIADKPPVYVSGQNNYAIRGYDPVAYHLDRKPVRGKDDYTAEWNGATWRFSSEANRGKFTQEPERWAPQYGGYCAWAVSRNYTASTDPDAWSIVDDRLYLNYSKSVRASWSQDIPGNIRNGDANWPSVLSK
ncbi:MAG: YHS domain-containing protein [Gammaproteobacteria bacterium]|nr:YHS domain-containing protein [Gammaproteobacteria bacterium]MCY4313974.1 YHS domain-containing protein [Gammaproteobacteria bacterium]